VEAEAVLRSVFSDLSADTPLGRRLETAAGPGFTERLQAMGELPVGGAVITPGGDLAVSFVIHAVIQSAEEPVRARSVEGALLNGLRRAAEWGIETLALPPLGTGAGNLDAEASAAAMVPVLREHLDASPYPREVIIAVASEYEEEVFLRAIGSAMGGVATEDG